MVRTSTFKFHRSLQRSQLVALGLIALAFATVTLFALLGSSLTRAERHFGLAVNAVFCLLTARRVWKGLVDRGDRRITRNELVAFALSLGCYCSMAACDYVTGAVAYERGLATLVVAVILTLVYAAIFPRLDEMLGGR